MAVGPGWSQPKSGGLHVHAALQVRPVGHDQPRSRDRTFDRAGLTDAHPPARLDGPGHLAENQHRLRRQLRLDPAGWTDRQNMLPQFDRPGDPAVDEDVLASLDVALDDDPLPIVVMSSGACGPPARCPRGDGGRLAETLSAGCVLTIVKCPSIRPAVRRPFMRHRPRRHPRSAPPAPSDTTRTARARFAAASLWPLPEVCSPSPTLGAKSPRCVVDVPA